MNTHVAATVAMEAARVASEVAGNAVESLASDAAVHIATTQGAEEP